MPIQDTDDLEARIGELVAKALRRFAGERLAYTIDEVAPLLGLPMKTLREAISRGELKAVKRGRRWMIRRDLLLRWLEFKGLPLPPSESQSPTV